MQRGIRLFKVLDIVISIDYTWFIVFFLFSWSLSRGYYPAYAPGLSAGTYLAMGVVTTILVFACVLIHELSHSYVSNRLGLRVGEITLFIFGGVAHLTHDPEDPSTEFKIAIAGPLASAALAVLFQLSEYAAAVALPAAPLIHVLSFLAMVNLVLMAFNLIPGLPLDGGRVLKAIWWRKTGSREKATEVASSVGKGFAAFLIMMGLMQIWSGNFPGGLWSVLIGVFLLQAAKGSFAQFIVTKTLEGIKVGDIMTENPVCMEADTELSEALDKYFFRYHFVSFPVTVEGRAEGLLSLSHIKGVAGSNFERKRAGELMEPLSKDNQLHPADSALKAFEMMNEQGRGRFPVLEGSRFVGVLSRRDIMKTLDFKRKLAPRP